MTTRAGGVSAGPRASFNLATHVGDDPAAVAENRRRLRHALGLPVEPAWLEQVHGTDVAVLPAAAHGTGRRRRHVHARPGLRRARRRLPAGLPREPRRAIASASRTRAGAVSPPASSRRRSPRSSASRASSSPGSVRRSVRAPSKSAPKCATRFSHRTIGRRRGISSRDAQGRFLADLPALARRRLAAAGVTAVSGGDLCTHADPARFFSFRRDGATGRMAALAWLA